MFADRAKIFIRSGKGGDGHVSFRRELYVPNGGPDGGDGGRGGDVIFEVDEGLNTLAGLSSQKKICCQRRRSRAARDDATEKMAEDIILKVPEGTVIKEAESGKVIADMSGDNRRQVILKGGRGGLGNHAFCHMPPCRFQNMRSLDSRPRSCEVKSGTESNRRCGSGWISQM